MSLQQYDVKGGGVIVHLDFHLVITLYYTYPLCLSYHNFTHCSIRKEVVNKREYTTELLSTVSYTVYLPDYTVQCTGYTSYNCIQ